jgi:hypothetical protein
MCLPLKQADIADLAIESLRKRSRWEVADQVLGLFGQKSYDVPIIRRSILRYALACPNNKAAETFVKTQRQRDPEWVSESEELLRLEGEDTTPAPPKKK